MIFLFSFLAVSDIPATQENHAFDLNETIKSAERKYAKLTEISEEIQSVKNSLREVEKAIGKIKGKKQAINTLNDKINEEEKKFIQEINQKTGSLFKEIKYPKHPINISLIELKTSTENITQSPYLSIFKLIFPKKYIKPIEKNHNGKWLINGTNATALFRSSAKERACSILFTNLTKESCNPRKVTLTWHNENFAKWHKASFISSDEFEFPQKTENVELRFEITPRWFREVEVSVKSTWGDSESTCFPEFQLFGERFIDPMAKPN